MKFIQLLLIAVASLALFACGSDPSGGGASISLNGGAGVNLDTAIDGHGGILEIFSAGDIKIAKSGYPDAVFTSYSSIQSSFGSNKATISTDTTVLLDPGSDPGPGVLYVRTDDWNLYVGGGTDLVVTGLEVAKGATLKFPANENSGTWVNVHIGNAVVISGTVTTSAESANLEMGSDSLIIIRTTGKVTTAATTAGSSGGDIWLYTYGVLVNLGAIDSSGASGGGSAGYASLYADGVILNTGSITAKGGDGSSAYPQGGLGGLIGIESGNAKIFSSGALNVNGGTGSTGPGGSARHIWIDGATGVDLVYSSISLNGGSGVANGGGAGGVIISQMPPINAPGQASVSPVTSGSISNDVPITARGGDGARSGGNTGGAGGLIGFGLLQDLNGVSLSTDITNSGAIDISGGAGDIGGSGGFLRFITADRVTNSAAITGKGGDGATQGGLGAYISLWAQNHAANSGAITANGGAATINGGNGGLIELFSLNAPPTTNSGVLSVVRGSGGTTAINGFINIDGVDKTP